MYTEIPTSEVKRFLAQYYAEDLNNKIRTNPIVIKEVDRLSYNLITAHPISYITLVSTEALTIASQLACDEWKKELEKYIQKDEYFDFKSYTLNTLPVEWDLRNNFPFIVAIGLATNTKFAYKELVVDTGNWEIEVVPNVSEKRDVIRFKRKKI